MTDTQAWSYFLLTVVAALILTVAPMPFDVPDWIRNLKPDWIFLCWFFWIVFQHERCSLIMAFVVGLILDVLYDEPLGINSLLLLALVFAGRLSLRFIQASVGLRSSIAVLILCFLVTATKSLFLAVTLDVDVPVSSVVMPPIATLLWWVLLIPLLNSEHSQFRDSVQ
ncbi:MAG: rod shape-determining protein MreD [Gammaproteobacteria bacterium]|nr:rod shape-determining protein MreD [Gammaproteobacteria bacterium]